MYKEYFCNIKFNIKPIYYEKNLSYCNSCISYDDQL